LRKSVSRIMIPMASQKRGSDEMFDIHYCSLWLF
jgi:hypothetical protein